MANGDALQEEQSKRIFWVIQTVFSLLLAKSLEQYKACILDPISAQYYLTTMGLVLVYGTALWSWIDYSYSTIVSPYNFGRGWLEKVRFFIDLLIVICYAFLLFSLESLQHDKSANISPMFWCLGVVFALYLASGLFRRIQYGRRSSRSVLILLFTGLFLVVAAAYSRIHAKNPASGEATNATFILLAMGATIGYRVLHSKAAYRTKWIAVDVDGVLANQIDNLLPILKRKYCVELQYADVKEWALKIGETDLAEIIKSEQKNKRYVQSMPVIPGAYEAVNRLIEKYKVVIVTARSPDSDAWTKKWLAESKLPYDAYVNMKEGQKHNTDIDHSILIDDYIGNVQKYLEESDGTAILFSQPWNENRASLQRFMEEGRLLVAKDWDDVLSKVSKLDSN